MIALHNFTDTYKDRGWEIRILNGGSSSFLETHDRPPETEWSRGNLLMKQGSVLLFHISIS